MKNIAIFASGSGTNAKNIIQYFSKIADVNVSMIFVNNPDAYVIKRAERFHIESFPFYKERFLCFGNRIGQADSLEYRLYCRHTEVKECMEVRFIRL